MCINWVDILHEYHIILFIQRENAKKKKKIQQSISLASTENTNPATDTAHFLSLVNGITQSFMDSKE